MVNNVLKKTLLPYGQLVDRNKDHPMKKKRVCNSIPGGLKGKSRILIWKTKNKKPHMQAAYLFVRTFIDM